MKTPRLALLPLPALVLLLHASAFGAEPGPRTLDAPVAEVSLFKNGLAHVVRDVAVPGPGAYLLRDLPVPVHGTFWLLPEGGLILEEAVSFDSPRREEVQPRDLTDLLRASVGKEVQVRYEDGWVKGVVETLPDEGPSADERTDLGERRSYRPEPALSSPPGFILLRTAEGALALPPSAIRAVRAEGLDRTLQRTIPGVAIRVKVAGTGRLRLSYVTTGLTWAPSYRVEMAGSGEAVLTAKAQLLNDAEELRGALVRCVTGFPNLAFAGVSDPAALVGSVRGFIEALSQPSGGRRSNPSVMSQSVTLNYVSMNEGSSLELPVLPEGETREDLYFQDLGRLTLDRGERGYYPLFEKRVPCQNIYTWDVADAVDPQNRWRASYDEEPSPREEEVWHALRLKNAGGAPWTTAPALTVQEGRVLGQDTLRYTAPGAETLLKVTRAVDILVFPHEEESGRQRNARTEYGGRTFDLVVVKGALKLINRKSKAVTVRVTKTLTGELVETAPKPLSATKRPEGVTRLNPVQDLVWEVTVEPGASQVLNFSYRMYVRS